MALPGTGYVNRGLQVMAGLLYNTADAFAVVQSMAVDDNASNFAAADTAANTSRGAITNILGKSFDATPTRSAQTITMTTTYTTAQANYTHKGLSLHNLTGASVTASSTSLIAGVFVNQSIAKNSNFSLAYTVTSTFTDNTP